LNASNMIVKLITAVLYFKLLGLSNNIYRCQERAVELNIA
jgi:hypothetical protein